MHFAESWNELHHLLIMEALGGNERWARARSAAQRSARGVATLLRCSHAAPRALQVDRALSQHTAVGLYWITCMMCVPPAAVARRAALRCFVPFLGHAR